MRLFTITTFAFLLNVILINAAPVLPPEVEKGRKEKENKERMVQRWRQMMRGRFVGLYGRLNSSRMRSMGTEDLKSTPICHDLQTYIELVEVRVCYIFFGL
jgi:hypothetical protein